MGFDEENMRTFLAFLLILWGGNALNSRVRHSEVAHPEHLYTQQAKASAAWSPDLATDFKVMHYDRVEGSVLGYVQSSGKVFVQHATLAGAAQREALALEDAFIVGMQPGQLAGSHQRPCEVLVLSGTDHSVHWRELPVGVQHLQNLHHTPWHYTWQAKSPSITGTRRVHLTSNGNNLLNCECHWQQGKGLYRSIRGVSRSHKCSAKHTPSHLPWKMHEQSTFCSNLQALLWSRSLLLVPASELIGHSSDAATCWQIGSKYLGRQHLPDSVAAGSYHVRPPRAQILSDIKHHTQGLTLIQGLLAVLSLQAEADITASVSHVQRNLSQTIKLYTYPGEDIRPSSHTMQTLEVELEPWQKLIDEAKDRGVPLPFAPERVCDASINQIPNHALLLDLLRLPVAAWTPEVANTTLVSQAFGQMALQIINCTVQNLEALQTYLQCMIPVGQRTHLATNLPRPKLLQAQIEQAPHGTFTPMDLADELVKKMGDAIQDCLLYAHSLTQLAANTQANNQGYAQTSILSWPMYVERSKAWCCARLKPAPMLVEHLNNTPLKVRQCIPLEARLLWLVH